MFLPLHNTAQILSSMNIDCEDEGAVRLEVSSGLHLSPSVQGSVRDIWHVPEGSPSTLPELCSHGLKTEIFPMKLAFFWSAPLQSFFQPFPINVLFSLRNPWDPSIQSLVHSSHEWEKGEHGNAPSKLRAGGFAFSSPQAEFKPQWSVGLVPCVHWPGEAESPVEVLESSLNRLFG